MNSRHRKTLAAIFSDPLNGALFWTDIENLLLACGAEFEEGTDRASALHVKEKKPFFIARTRAGKHYATVQGTHGNF
jgi:hypothetical protein